LLKENIKQKGTKKHTKHTAHVLCKNYFIALQADSLPSEPPGKPCNPHLLSQERKSTQGSLQGRLPPTPVYTVHRFSWLFNPVCLFQNRSITLAQVPLHSPQSRQGDRHPAMEPSWPK